MSSSSQRKREVATQIFTLELNRNLCRWVLGDVFSDIRVQQDHLSMTWHGCSKRTRDTCCDGLTLRIICLGGNYILGENYIDLRMPPVRLSWIAFERITQMQNMNPAVRNCDDSHVEHNQRQQRTVNDCRRAKWNR